MGKADRKRPKPPPAPPAGPAAYDWPEDAPFDDDAQLTPARRRRRYAAHVAIMTAFAELVNAMARVLDARPKDPPGRDQGWWTDTDAIRYFARLFNAGWEGQSRNQDVEAAAVEFHRRRDAFNRGGTHFGCPVEWADASLEGAKLVLEKHKAHLAPGLAADAANQLWLFETAAPLWQGAAHRRKKREAQEAALNLMLTEAIFRTKGAV